MPHSALLAAAPGATVVDLRSRHVPAGVAAQRLLVVLDQRGANVEPWSPVRVHKIDSTLRGNWATEIAAAVASGRRVLMLPSYPAAGRVCRGGVVTEHGTPVHRSRHADDVRSPVVTSRPASVLEGAEELSTAADVSAWLSGSGYVAVADAGDDDELDQVVRLACADELLLVGTAAVVGAAARHIGASTSGAARIGPGARLAPPVLVVCGSLHPVSRAQVDVLAQRRDPSVVVVASSTDRTDDPGAVVEALAEHAHRVARTMGAATVVLLGGDTAAAFVGERIVRVAGSIGVGVALGSITIDGRDVALVAKPGAFGSANTLVDLMPAPSSRSDDHG